MNKDYYNSPAVSQLMSMYYKDSREERLGQFFCNRFIRGPWEFLYHMEDHGLARQIIAGWLKDHQYYETLPEQIN